MNGRINFTQKRSAKRCHFTLLLFLNVYQVHQKFGELFALKIVLFLQEIVSVVTTPFVLWFSLPPCAPAIVDFFHDFTVWVPGRGYICSFAEFDFKRHGNVKVRELWNAITVYPIDRLGSVWRTNKNPR